MHILVCESYIFCYYFVVQIHDKCPQTLLLILRVNIDTWNILQPTFIQQSTRLIGIVMEENKEAGIKVQTNISKETMKTDWES